MECAAHEKAQVAARAEEPLRELRDPPEGTEVAKGRREGEGVGDGERFSMHLRQVEEEAAERRTRGLARRRANPLAEAFLPPDADAYASYLASVPDYTVEPAAAERVAAAG